MKCDKADYSVPKLASSRFNLITWNVHKGQDKGWQEDLARLSKQADFVLLQEATLASKFKHIFDRTFVSFFFF